MTVSRERIVASFLTQAQWCDRLGSPFTARLMDRTASELERGGMIAAIIGDRPGNSNADGLPLRFAGALHALVLANADPALAEFYPARDPTPDPDRLWRAVESALAEQPSHFAAYLAQPPQTNEVGRSALLLPGFLAIARATGLPLRLLEIGASAGLNLIWDRYRYRYGAQRWGDPDSPLELTCEWRGANAELDPIVAILSRAACDQAPIDVHDDGQRARLRSYIWADQTDRLARLDGALALARAANVHVEPADCADWLDRKLAEPAEGCVTLLYHSVVWQYLPAETRGRIRARLAEVGRRATRRNPLVHLALEFGGQNYELRLTLWSGDGMKIERHLATTHPHGLWLEWLVEN
jgi:hypothetical protein